MSHNLELASLYKKLEDAFAKSNIKVIAESNKYEWNYSLLATPFYKNSLVVVGFNFGTIENQVYQKQQVDDVPTENWSEQKDLGSLIRIKKYLNDYCPEYNQEQIVQTNYCFFRSKAEDQISENDIKLCQPIFNRLIELLDPKFILCLSSKLLGYIEKERSSEFTTKEINLSKRKILIARGHLKINSRDVPFGYIPHPNYPMKKESRQEAWKFVFNK